MSHSLPYDDDVMAEARRRLAEAWNPSRERSGDGVVVPSAPAPDRIIPRIPSGGATIKSFRKPGKIDRETCTHPWVLAGKNRYGRPRKKCPTCGKSSIITHREAELIRTRHMAGK